MRAVSIESVDGKVCITTETKFLWWKRTRKFLCVDNVAGIYNRWLEIPGKRRVPDIISFQLDHWKAYGI